MKQKFQVFFAKYLVRVRWNSENNKTLKTSHFFFFFFNEDLESDAYVLID